MIDAAIAAARFGFDAGTLFLFGAGAFVCLLVPRPLRQQLWVRLSAVRGWSIAAVLVATLTVLPLRTAVIGGGWEAAGNPEMLVAVIPATNIGTAWSIQIVVAMVLALGQTLAPQRFGPAPYMVLAGVLLASLSLTGHAAMSPGWMGLAQQLNNTLHLLAAGAWVGALPALIYLFPLLRDPERRADAGLALRRFSTAGHFAVILVAASGIVSTLLITGNFPPAPTSAYRSLLLIKIGLVVAMILCAVVNRYVIVPKLRNRPGAIRALVVGTVAEIVLVAGVLGLVAIFGMIDPGT
ncbi:MAG: copper homeostasis membrane protein CopD [Devosia sp.]